MKEMDSDKIRQMVRGRYAQAAAGGFCGCQSVGRGFHLQPLSDGSGLRRADYAVAFGLPQ